MEGKGTRGWKGKGKGERERGKGKEMGREKGKGKREKGRGKGEGEMGREKRKGKREGGREKSPQLLCHSDVSVDYTEQKENAFLRFENVPHELILRHIHTGDEIFVLY